MKVIGKMTKLMVMASTSTQMEPSIQVNGKKTNNMDMVRRHGLTVPVMRETIRKVKRTDKENSYGLMDLPTLDNSLITTFMV